MSSILSVWHICSLKWKPFDKIPIRNIEKKKVTIKLIRLYQLVQLTLNKNYRIYLIFY